jgi:hypothetical protein
MKWKPEEADIIDYLYGTMSNEKRTKFEIYLNDNPELQKEINELRQTQKVLPSFQDEEVIPPIPFPGTINKGIHRGQKWLYPVSIAASIALILLTGYLTNFRMSFNDAGFELGFVEPQTMEMALTQEDVEKMIASRLTNYNQEVSGRLTAMSDNFDQQLVANREWSEQRMVKLANSSSKAELDESQVLQFMNQLQVENDKMMQNFYQASTDEQRTYLRNILLEYSEYIEQQRQEDLQYLQANLRDIRSNSDLKQEATDKILANIISTVNNQNLSVPDTQILD